MTGKGGRPAKSTAFHLAAGTYREDRHGGKADAYDPPGAPAKPTGLSPEAEAIWESLWGSAGLALVQSKAIDTAAAEAVARNWAAYRACLQAAELDPMNEKARKGVATYGVRFDTLAARFGLTPSDRAKLRVEPPKVKDKDGKGRFFRGNTA